MVKEIPVAKEKGPWKDTVDTLLNALGQRQGNLETAVCGLTDKLHFESPVATFQMLRIRHLKLCMELRETVCKGTHA